MRREAAHELLHADPVIGVKADRDANLILQNAAGVTVNRWNTTGFLVSSAISNESGYLSVKMARGLGMVAVDTQARI